MKLSIKVFTILFAASTMFACNSDDKTSTTDTTKNDSISAAKPDATGDTSKMAMKNDASNASQDFVDYAVPSNMKEIAWLKAGMANASSKEIKSHASMMLKDHNKLGADVKDFMSKHSDLKMPSVDTTNEVNINDKKGADWDKAWIDKMVDDHSSLLDKLKKTQSDSKDADLTKVVSGAIPVVESHLAMVKSMQDKMKK